MHYAAIGDSFTEGVGDEVDGGEVRGWADMVALGLAAASDETVHYANLAIRGRLLAPIATEQIDAALALSPQPDLITVDGGGNDMLRPGWDLNRMMELTRRMVDRSGEEGVRLIILTGAPPSSLMPRADAMFGRAREFTDLVGELVEPLAHASLIDNLTDDEMRRPAYWADDRLHLNELGHSRIAARVLGHLGVETELPSALDPDPGRPGLAAELRYARRHVLPWIGRRLTGRSSGDGRVPKHADWAPVPASMG
ncbi:SGNH/GDSL hydrolase family protein [Demequina zhanjiangensis]|uniref:SGNH/GDSL hydrolase family protein n=1 Tax=Demequina zhanjiangensis TaxID=3051659 RepID=A0ABT8FZW1_9MICO|nr:SGNH/GDSL hydrolase family protein [Demequina sp. SYSU T00b26]MDN4472423.1 SGNH/GDSL hydrolase family protein [Demequina sp. SYSU T00b26]